MPAATSVRLAACEPCRRTKLACGHEKPVCARCSGRGQDGLCEYRETPFKRRKAMQEPSDAPDILDLDLATNTSNAPTGQRLNYPNPGFLGSSSHSTIFNHVLSNASTITSNDGGANAYETPRQSDPTDLDQTLVAKGVNVLTRLSQLNTTEIKHLIHFWRATGANPPLAEHFVLGCTEAVVALLVPAGDNSQGWASRLARRLLTNSQRPLVVRKKLTASEYLSQMYGVNMRWESLGLFLTASSRAALAVSFFPSLYTTDTQRRDLIKTLACLGDDCLELCLRLDCINDLQLVLQYENFIVFSQVYGDQNYISWRKMGDLASSLYALGYHEKIDDESEAIPPYINQLRKAALSRIYTGDKSLAIFLGRPPRIVKPYCLLRLPRFHPNIWAEEEIIGTDIEVPGAPDVAHDRTDLYLFRDTDPIDCIADTCCAALFASFKEDILELFRHRDIHRRIQKARLKTLFHEDVDLLTEVHSDLRAQVDEQWHVLPTHFKLTTRLKECSSSPLERDFLVGTRLDYLHTVFLLDLVTLRNMTDPGNSLLTTAREMLLHVVDAVILRNHLVNSGTCLIWKVAFYGLSAAGILSLALLNPSACGIFNQMQRAEITQNLSVLVTEIRLGAVVGPGEPNFELFTQAMRTMQNLLDNIMTAQAVDNPAQSNPLGANELTLGSQTDGWTQWLNAEPWEFELDFWTNLAEHPSLSGLDSAI